MIRYEKYLLINSIVCPNQNITRLNSWRFRRLEKIKKNKILVFLNLYVSKAKQY